LETFSTDPLSAIPAENRRSLHELAKSEKEQEGRNRYWARRLLLIFVPLIALYLAFLYFGIPGRS
jgi:hypothetical protein